MFTLPPLPYTPDALEPWVDELTVKIHHDKHHQAYVDGLNKALEGHEDLLNKHIEEILSNMETLVPVELRTKVRNFGGGHANHTLFWQIMKLNPKAEKNFPTGNLATKIDTTFGNFDSFKEQFTQVAMSRFGSGWAWLTINFGELLIMDSPNQDSPLMEGRTPIMGLDVWEHAYYLKYQNKRLDYVNNWWNIINWEIVEENFNKAITH